MSEPDRPPEEEPSPPDREETEETAKTGEPALPASLPSPGSVEWSELISRFGHGHDSALGELIEREAPRLLRKIEAALPDPLRARVGASDILQQTLIDLMRVQDRFDNRGTAAFRSMMQTMAEARIARAIRRERALKRDILREVGPPKGFGEDGARVAPGPVSGWERVPGDAETPSGVVGAAESADRLRDALKELSEDDRTIIRLIDYDDVGYVRAAEQLGIEVKAAQKRHSRAMARLKSLLERDD